ncbi:MAG TPA: lamin tail domain-containing protein [Verrucomicrobiae bacterium]
MDIGTTVNGYQDDFDGSTLASDWQVSGQEAYSVADGLLQVTTVSGDPNHLLYAGGTYDAERQEVLARIRIRDFGTGDASRAGLGTAVNPGNSQGINFFFRDEPSPGQRHVEFLDDLRAWGTEFPFFWQNDTWYWMRVRHEPSSAGPDVFGKIWRADGTQAEPANWQVNYEYVPGRSARSGLAGIAASSSGGVAELDVDYILIKAEGLPSIVAAPRSAVQTPASITQHPQSQSVDEGRPVSFAATAGGNPAPTLQWYRGNQAVPGATAPELKFDSAALVDNNASFYVIAQNVVSNTARFATSAPATLTVRADTVRPSLVSAQSSGLTQVLVTFSEAVTAASATNLGSYIITNSAGVINVTAALLGGSGSNVVLSVSPLQEGATYILVVNNLRDRSSAGNQIQANSSATFTAVSYTPAPIGNPQPAGSIIPVAGGYNVRAGGNGIGGTADEMEFSYQARSGDFDVKVRVAAVGLTDPWAEAGLMAREDVSAGSRFAAVLTTPTISGSLFKARTSTGTGASLTGSFPVNHPETWLRLQRVGSIFTGYASFDGQTWVRLGSSSIALPSSVLLGFGASSRNTSHATVASFRDFLPVSAGEKVIALPSFELLGQSSRLTSLVFSEIMYRPRPATNGANLEFIEILNTLGTPEDISGYQLSGDVDYTFPAGTVVPGGGFLVIARNPSEIQARYGITGVLGPFPNGLPNNGGTVRLRNRQGAILLEVEYNNRNPWPAAADGAGASLVLSHPSYGEGDPKAWSASDTIDGTPGQVNTIRPSPAQHVVINEILAHTDDPELDFVELYNHSNQPIDLAGYILTDDPLTNKYVINGSVTVASIPARGFLSFDQDTLGFALSADGETVYLKSPTGQVIDAFQFGPQENGVAFGRKPDGANAFYRLASKTPSVSNAAIRVSDVVINEIMYHPISENDEDQFVELFNRGTTAIDLSGWEIGSGIDFTFPANTLLGAGAYLTVAKNVARLRTNYSSLTTQNSFGNFSGALSRSGERITLTRPDTIVSTNSTGQVSTNNVQIVVDEVTYRDGGRWGQWSDGGGSSLEKIDADADGRHGSNWADSNETSKAPWTQVSVTGPVDNGSTSSADQLQVLLQGAGECLIDNVEVLNSSGVNQIANSTFESSASGWTAEGTQDKSSWESSEGYNSARSYHVRALERGDNQLNRIRTPLSAPLAQNSTATIRARVRWLKGHPEALFRLRGNWLEAAGSMALPTSLGTPSARNSRAATNHGPAIYEVSHAPVAPQAGESVLITTKASDHDGVANPALQYRIDPSSTYTTLGMRDDGTAGDEVASDGIFSARIPAQSAGTVVAFYITASDSASVSARFPASTPAREGVIRFGDSTPTGNFPVYRIWMTDAVLNEWTSRAKLNNTPMPITYVLGNSRVIYEASGLYAGSPYISPGYSSPQSGRCGYSLSFPSDDRFLGDSDLVLDWPGGHGGERTAMQEQMAYWLAEQVDLPYSHRYNIRLHVNGVTDMQRGTVFEAVNQPAGDFIDAWMPNDDDGDFYKIDRAFEFSDGGSLIADPQPRLQNYTTVGGAKKTERYRWTFLKRAADRVNNYTNIFNLVDALNATSPEPYTSATDALVDLREWMGILALEHIIVNFDAYGHEIGKNMYAYKPQEGKWQLYMFDLDWLMLAAANRGASYSASSAQLYNADDPTMVRMYNHPPFRRAYLQTVRRAVDGSMQASICNPVMDAKHRSLVANGITHCDGQTLTDPAVVKTWFAQRRTYLLNQLTEGNASFAITSNSGNNLTTNTSTITLSGTASLGVYGLRINGIEQSVAWTGLTTWSVTVPLRQGANVLFIEALDHTGAVASGDQITVTTSAGTEPPRVLINEWMAANSSAVADPADGNFEDWFELYNPNTFAVDLSGWQLADNIDLGGARWPIPSGTMIPANGYLLVWADEEPEQNTPTNAHLHADFRLSQNGETIALFNPQSLLIDSVQFGAQTNNVSQGRSPDGGTNLVFFTSPSPGGSIQVLRPDLLNPLRTSAESIRLEWISEVGRSYRLQYTDDVESPTWAVVTTITATGARTFLDVASSGTSRFYRVQLVQP